MKTFCNQLIPQAEIDRAEEWIRFVDDNLTEKAAEEYSRYITVLLLHGYPLPPVPRVTVVSNQGNLMLFMVNIKGKRQEVNSFLLDVVERLERIEERLTNLENRRPQYVPPPIYGPPPSCPVCGELYPAPGHNCVGDTRR